MSSIKIKKITFFSNLPKIKKVIINGKKFWTVIELAKELEVKPNTVKQRLFQAEIKPVCKDAIYEESTLESIRNIQIGRPKKPAPGAPKKLASKVPKKIRKT